jgi:hypothetical protein
VREGIEKLIAALEAEADDEVFTVAHDPTELAVNLAVELALRRIAEILRRTFL